MNFFFGGGGGKWVKSKLDPNVSGRVCVNWRCSIKRPRENEREGDKKEFLAVCLDRCSDRHAWLPRPTKVDDWPVSQDPHHHHWEKASSRNEIIELWTHCWKKKEKSVENQSRRVWWMSRHLVRHLNVCSKCEHFPTTHAFPPRKLVPLGRPHHVCFRVYRR